MLFARYQSRLLVWLASLSLLVAFIGAMTVQFIGGARLLETAAGIPMRRAGHFRCEYRAVYRVWRVPRQRTQRHDAGDGDAHWHSRSAGGYRACRRGLSHAVETTEAIDPKLVSPQGRMTSSPTFMTSFWVLVCFGVIGLPHTAVRCISYKDSKAVHRGIIIGTIVVAILMFGMHGGRAGPRGDP